MRKLLLGAVAAFAVTAPGSASAGDGYFGLSYSSADQGSGVDSINFGGAANFDLTSSLEAQVDGNFTRVETSSGFNHTYSTANLHVFHRTDGYLFGGYFGYDEPAFGADSFSLGVEGQLYLSRLSLDGAVAYTTAEGGAAFDESGATMRAGATWFPTDNLSIGAGYRNLDVDGIGVETTSLNAEWQFGSAPLSVTAGYRTNEFENSAIDGFDTWEIGVRWSLGTGSLFERNRSGASLPTAGAIVGGVY